MRKNDRLSRWAGIAALLLVVHGCSSDDDPEQRIRETLNTMALAAEGGDRAGFMDHVADDFTGQQGHFDRKGISDLLRVQLLKHTRVNATIMSQEYQLFEGRATGEMTVLLTGGPGNWLPDAGRVYRIETSWQERDGDWFLLGADWETVVGTR